MAFDLVCQGLIGKVNFKLQILNFKSKLKFKWKNYFVLITIFENIGESSLASCHSFLQVSMVLGFSDDLASNLSQYWVSLASFLQMEILFLKSFLLDAPLASA
ncbi:hypothetical protein A3H89_00170 [Candidatus Amesbacteria bacterium RIFCSPLOWO2_02_FULL_48_11]|uniref:Uncharacterized protein n=2 Tax=Candidatus Amesiibacteriota TaxID=1752730 RepID=A0A1F4Z9F7_9BACT|nr:MAG: hypothetical protein A2702_01730 [Candidatus Amesbacteria bacterium RIFCSPHIGHO2_01_FULL_48_75]OGD02241.1 MAG: hypothetical protein A2354_01040 [Candidatus Amesbacteria bacterium RIFOXYB1_FULL_47_12]OGD02888.1 MAG: hypothetical protein A3E17_01365 [Candidatus Amesbacteria bacterium RIFCSPHIGHO2_12_FULL_48_14]OGD05729.1 MAG: hypothetical protein A3H89_00170 [Candidatus Amesbacteria bacterium RIFCSPLOWO2_02_FULL_48_11]OGD06881.1 MAG: hypothetical protein A3B58_01880 [Candidatus Amesbacter